MSKITTCYKIATHFLQLTKEFGINAAFHIELMQHIKGVQYKHNYILSYFEKEYSEKINKYKQKEFPLEIIDANCTIWVCWFQGEDSMPETIKYCYESIKKFSGERTVQLITLQNFREFISLPNYIVEKVENGTISLTHFSDIIRCNLLSDYGGVYIDAGLLLTDKLQIPKLPFFSIKLHKPENDCSFVSKYRWLAGFMGGVKGNALHLFMKDFFNAYHREHSMLIDYFLVDYTIATAYKNIPVVRKMIDAVPYNNEDIYYIGANLFAPVKENELKTILKKTSIFRIGYKGIPQEINDNSLYAYIFTL